MPEIPFSHKDIQQLESYAWPGNVRELKNLVERCLLLGRLPNDILDNDNDDLAGGYPDSWSLEKVEQGHIIKVLDNMRGNKTQASKSLGVSRKTLDRKLQAWTQDQLDD